MRLDRPAVLELHWCTVPEKLLPVLGILSRGGVFLPQPPGWGIRGRGLSPGSMGIWNMTSHMNNSVCGGLKGLKENERGIMTLTYRCRPLLTQ